MTSKLGLPLLIALLCAQFVFGAAHSEHHFPGIPNAGWVNRQPHSTWSHDHQHYNPHSHGYEHSHQPNWHFSQGPGSQQPDCVCRCTPPGGDSPLSEQPYRPYPAQPQQPNGPQAVYRPHQPRGNSQYVPYLPGGQGSLESGQPGNGRDVFQERSEPGTPTSFSFPSSPSGPAIQPHPQPAGGVPLEPNYDPTGSVVQPQAGHGPSSGQKLFNLQTGEPIQPHPQPAGGDKPEYSNEQGGFRGSPSQPHSGADSPSGSNQFNGQFDQPIQPRPGGPDSSKPLNYPGSTFQPLPGGPASLQPAGQNQQGQHQYGDQSAGHPAQLVDGDHPGHYQNKIVNDNIASIFNKIEDKDNKNPMEIGQRNLFESHPFCKPNETLINGRCQRSA